MPLMRCTKDGKQGWKYGKSGKCYTGSGARAKAEKQGKAIEAGKHSNNVLQSLTGNMSAHVRYETLEGRNYLVVPMVMLTEGVHSGTRGPLYYPAEELSNLEGRWDHRPIVVYHPEINGAGVSACSPDMVNSRKVGVVFNTRWDSKAKKLRAEAWLDIDRLSEVDDRVLNALENDETMEVSTGVFSDNERSEGVWNGEEYAAIARNYRLDHLAILPDQKGACSVEDGAGLLQLNKELEQKAENNPLLLEAIDYLNSKLARSGLIDNELSHGDIRRELFSEVRSRFGEDIWIEEVYDDNFIYSRLDKLHRLGYTVNGNEVTLGEGTPEEVHQVIDYVPVKNQEGKMPKEKKTAYEDKVNNLISNEQTKWEEDDREFLSSLDEDQLDKMFPIENEDKKAAGKLPPVSDPEQVQKVVDKAAKDVGPQEQETKTANNKEKSPTLDEHIETLPSEIQEFVREGLMIRNAEKARLVEIIVNDDRNRFTEDQLNKKPLGELQAIADLCRNEEEEGPDSRYPQYVGASGSHIRNTKAEDEITEEPLEAPAMNWADDTT